MSSRMKIYCKNIHEYIDIEGGESLQEIAEALAPRLRGLEPICAAVNNKTEPLQYQLFGPKQVEFLPRESASGTRVYVRSLSMMLFCTVRQEMPSTRLRIEHSIAGGYYCLLFDVQKLADGTTALQPVSSTRIPAIVECLRARMRELCKRDIPFERNHPDRPAPEVDQEKMYRAFVEYSHFNEVIGVANVGQLNRVVEEGKAADLINVAEAMHDKKISSIADEITRRYRLGGARIVLIAGPSSSGKTTTTKRLGIYLTTNLLKPKMISLDNYFVDRDKTPRDATGDYDFESLHALDLKAFNADLNALLSGEEVSLPTYSFEQGKRIYKGNKLRLEPKSILLVEGIHGLNPALTSEIPEEMKYRVYVSALTTLSIDDHNWIPTTDNRLLRRIIRDYKYRGSSAEETIRRWPSVRRGEEKWIFPFQENADSTFNSSLLFELGVIKDYAEAVLREVPNDVPEYAEAYRLRRFLGYFKQIPERGVPSTSLLREFLGGSSFHY